MKIVFLDQANREFSDAVQYYDSQEPGLGQRFEVEIERAIHWLSANPEVCALRRGILSADEPPRLSVLYSLRYS